MSIYRQMSSWGLRSWSAGRRRGAVTSVAVTLLLVVAACGGGGSDDAAGLESVQVGPLASEDQPTRGGALTVALASETSSFAPAQFTSGNLNAILAVYDPLVTRDESGELRPYLAESVEPNHDYTRWTVTVRPNVRFHDGTPLDADALKRAFDDHLLREGAVTAQTTEFVESVDVVDELTVAYVLTEPHAAFPDWLEQLPLGWPFSPDAADERGDDFGDEPVGTGPFQFVRWQRDGELVLERNDDYWQDGLPYLDQITFQPIPDESTRRAALEAGDVDAIEGAGLSPVAAEAADITGVRVVLGPGNSGTGVFFNTTTPPTDDVRVRQALAHAVDQEPLIEVAADDAAELIEPRTQYYPSDSPFYSDAVAEAWPDHDPERAQELYQDYIDDPDRSDGKDTGEPAEVTLNATTTTGELAAGYQGFYEQAGFEIQVETMDQEDLVSAALNGDYQATLFRQGGDRDPLGEFLLSYGDAELISNFAGFHDQVISDVLDRLRVTGDQQGQADLAEEMGLYLAEAAPWYWLADSLTFIAAHNEVRGLRSWEFPDGTLGDGTAPSTMLWGHAWLQEDAP